MQKSRRTDPLLQEEERRQDLYELRFCRLFLCTGPLKGYCHLPVAGSPRIRVERIDIPPIRLVEQRARAADSFLCVLLRIDLLLGRIWDKPDMIHFCVFCPG